MARNYPRIENWTVIWDPRGGRIRLAGHVENHPRPEHDGQLISTSEIRLAEGKVVLCESRSYEVGVVDPEFVRRCGERQIAFDPENPAPAIMATVVWFKEEARK